MLLAGLFVVSYVLGAVPFGVLVARSQGADLSKIGSGNIGATNVGRALGTKWMLAVFLLDLLKGFAGSFAARAVDDRSWIWYLVGLAAVAGHCASPFLRFKGGKGVATSLGMVFGASPLVAASGFGLFLVLFALTRIVSLSSIIAIAASVGFGAVFGDWAYVGVGSALFLFVLYTHRANIGRLMKGTEPKFTFRKAHPETSSAPPPNPAAGQDPGSVACEPDPVGEVRKA